MLMEFSFSAGSTLIGWLAFPFAKLFLYLGITPNQVTASRMLIFAPINAWLILSEYQDKYVYILINSAIGFFSDAIDGKMARLSGKKTDFGKLLDPMADKIFILSVVFLIVEYDLRICLIISFLQVTSGIVAGYLRFFGGISADTLQAERVGKTKMFCYSLGFLLYFVYKLILETLPVLLSFSASLLTAGIVLILVGIPLDAWSQSKKIKKIL